MLILSIIVTTCMLLYYQLLVTKENQFIKKSTNSYGKYIDSSNLNYFFVNGQDNLRWGLELYLHQHGIIIGNPLNDSYNLEIPLTDIKDLTIEEETICFYYNLHNSYLPSKFEISCGQLKKFSNTLQLNILNNQF